MSHEMSFTTTQEAEGIEAVSRLHRHEELLLPSTDQMECKNARRLGVLNACIFLDVAHQAFPSRLSTESKVLPIGPHTHKPPSISSTSVNDSVMFRSCLVFLVFE